MKYFAKLLGPPLLFLAILTFATLSLRAQEVSSKFDDYLNSQVRDSGFVGTVHITQANRLIINESVGSSSAAGMSSGRSPIPLGQIAEQFIAVAALQLQAKGKFSLDSPICDYISNCPTNWEQIHIVHLLTHSSGLPNLETASVCPETLIAVLSGKPLLFKPGARFNDNESDYLFVQLAIERSSGKSTKQYVEVDILQVLNLKHTYAELARLNNCKQSNRSASGPSLYLYRFFSTVDDLSVWENALATHQILPPTSQEQMFVPYIEGHGLGWKIIKEFDRKVAIQESNSSPTSVSIRRYPDDDTTIIVVSFARNDPAVVLSHDLGALLFGKHYPVNAKPAQTDSRP